MMGRRGVAHVTCARIAAFAIHHFGKLCADFVSLGGNLEAAESGTSVAVSGPWSQP
jgi:hypothetical protein